MTLSGSLNVASNLISFQRRFRKAQVYLILVPGIIMLASCWIRDVDVLSVENAQLRNTLRAGRYQFNAELIIQLKARETTIGFSELDVFVNDVYLGKAVIGAETLSLPEGRQRLPFRVVFPDTLLVLTSPNTIRLDGHLMLNGKQRKVQFSDSNLSVLNLTGM